jgi:hypothetical protein
MAAQIGLADVKETAELYRYSVFAKRMLSWRDFVAALVVFALLVLLGLGLRQMMAPVAAAMPQEISLSPLALPNYVLRTTLRMFIALAASLLFTFTYATLAAKSRRAEMVLIPLLDILQTDDQSSRNKPSIATTATVPPKSSRTHSASRAMTWPTTASQRRGLLIARFRARIIGNWLQAEAEFLA